MPQRAKSRLSAPKKRRIVRLADLAAPICAESDDSLPATDQVPAAFAEPVSQPRRFAEARLENYAMLGWSNNYRRLFQLEAAANRAHEHVGDYMSTYRLRQLKAGGAAAERALDKSTIRISHDYERLNRERCMHYIPFSQVVKGASMLVDQVKGLALAVPNLLRI